MNLVLGWVVSCSALGAATITVDLSGGADFTDIQSAVDATAAGDTVLVRPGEYVVAEPLCFNRLHDPLDPGSPPLKDLVVRSEAGPASTTIRMSQTSRQGWREAVVLFDKGETSASALEGFTLAGGGLMRWDSGSQEEVRGGLFCVNGSSPTILGCKVVRSSGYGVFCAASGPRIMGCEIEDHPSNGIMCTRNSSPTLIDCVISRNSQGGLYCRGSSPTLTNCAIVQNTNQEWSASGVNCAGSSPVFINCTIAGNSSITTGVISCQYDSMPSFLNCIVWDNASRAIVSDGTSAPAFSFSCVEATEAWPGEGNINADPRFCGWRAPEIWVDAAAPGPGLGTRTDPYPSLASAAGNHQLSLGPDSPCLGSGKEGANIGCALGPCEEPGSRTMLVHLAPGSYSMEGYNLCFHASLRGVGQDATRIEGPVAGSRTGATIDDLAVTGGTHGGIGIAKGQAPAISNCTIANNAGGGVFCGSEASPTVTNCTISDNTGDPGYGGGGVLCYNKATPILNGCTITRNSAQRGGGLSCVFESSPTLLGCSITNNHADDEGGGVYCYEGSSAKLTDCLIERNSAGWDGGGVASVASPMTLTRCTIRGNSPSGAYCDSEPSATLVNCRISDNKTNGHGAGIVCANASPLVLNCVISGNHAGPGYGVGGGLYCLGSSARIVGCLVVGNSGWFGGGVACSSSSPTLVHCTIAENWASGGGGMHLSDDSMAVLRNCILWDNTARPVSMDARSDVVAQYCCVDPAAGLSGENNLYVDPLFVEPGHWFECGSGDDPDCIVYEWGWDSVPAAWHAWSGGDYDLRSDSPAIGAASCDPGVPADMLGYPRPTGPGCDMGAIEHVGVRPDRFRRADANDDQKINIGDPVAILGFLFLGEPARLPCAKSADVDDGGAIDIGDAISLLGFLFLGAEPPARPFPECGVDITADSLICGESRACR